MTSDFSYLVNLRQRIQKLKPLIMNNSLQNSSNHVCVNCWGRFEYDDQFSQPIIDIQRDVNGNRKQYNFIKKWVVRFIDGIRLKK